MKRLFVYLILLLSGLCSAQTLLTIDEDFKELKIGQDLTYLTSAKGAVQIVDFLHPLHPIPSVSINQKHLLMFDESDYQDDIWIFFKITNSTSKSQSLILNVNNSLIDHLEFYRTQGGQILNKSMGGDVHPFSMRPVKYRTFLFPILLESGDTHTVYMKFNLSGRKIHLPITLYSSERFIEVSAATDMGLAFVYGILALLAALFLYLYLLIKDRAFLFFGIYVSLHDLLLYNVSGAAFAYFWPEFPMLADRGVAILMELSMIVAIEFVFEFIGRHNFKKWQIKLLRVFQTLLFLLCSVSILNGPVYNASIFVLYRLIPPFYLVMLLIGIGFFIKKFRHVRVFLLAFIAALVSIAGMLYYSNSGEHNNVLTNRAVLYGELFKCVLLGLALLDRFRIFKEEKEKNQELAIHRLSELNHLREQTNKDLEDKVAQKTQELTVKQQEVNMALISGEEKERRRIARELHDGMGSLLSTLRLKAEAIDLSEKNLTEMEQASYQNVLEMIDRACSELRTISHNMLPAGLEHFGLVKTMESLVRRINQSGKTQFQLDMIGMEKGFGADTDIHLYRILLELINNVIRHAHAENATVQVVRLDDSISMLVEDDGIGFEITSQQLESIGLLSVRSRVEALRGKVQIDSHPGSGTTITLEIPLEENE